MNSIEKKLIKRRREMSKSYPRMFARVAEDFLYANEPKAALKTAVRGVNTHPEYMPGQWMLAHALAETGNIRDAVIHVTTMLEKVGFDRYGAAMLAELYERQGEKEGALRLWAELYQLDPFDTTVERKLVTAVTEGLQQTVSENLDFFVNKLDDGLFLYSAAASLLSGDQIEQRLNEAVESLKSLEAISNLRMNEVTRPQPKPEPLKKPAPEPIKPQMSIAEIAFPQPSIEKLPIPALPPPDPYAQLLTTSVPLTSDTNVQTENPAVEGETAVAEEQQAPIAVENPIWEQPLAPDEVVAAVELPPEETPLAEETAVDIPHPVEVAEEVPTTAFSSTTIEQPRIEETDPTIAAIVELQIQAMSQTPVSMEPGLLEEMPHETEQAEPPKPRKKPRPLISKTIAELYAQQTEFQRAAEVYRELIKQQPDRFDFKTRLAQLEQLALSQPTTRRTNEDAD